MQKLSNLERSLPIRVGKLIKSCSVTVKEKSKIFAFKVKCFFLGHSLEDTNNTWVKCNRKCGFAIHQRDLRWCYE